MKNIFGFLFLTLMTLQNASADGGKKTKLNFYLGTYGQTEELDKERVTHIIVIGTGHNKDGDIFVNSATTRAMKYKEIYPDEQVVIIGSPQVGNENNEDVLTRYGFANLDRKIGNLSGKRLVKEMEDFPRIASFDFYGHSQPWSLVLQGSIYRFNVLKDAKQMERLADNFLPGAYAGLYGCNAGLVLAPELSKLWRIPVAGAASSTVYELMSTGNTWYKYFYASKYEKSKTNNVSFEAPVSCENGGCMRMKPVHHAYAGYWGDFFFGLEFYKYFCNYSGASTNNCQKAMAKSLLTFPSLKAIGARPSRADFEEVVYDWLCISGKTTESLQECKEGIQKAIKKGDRVYKQFMHNTLQCDLKQCDFAFDCKKKFLTDFKEDTCKVIAKFNDKPTTMVDEYLSLMLGYDELMK
jgi:hypothetical protein